MKRKIINFICVSAFLAIAQLANAQTNASTTASSKMEKQCESSATCCGVSNLCDTYSANCYSDTDKVAITKAIDYYIEGGRKGSSEIARKGFAETATMSWYENGKLQSVPIQELYDLYDNSQNPQEDVSYEMTLCNVAGDIAVVRIESQFGKKRYTDMFTLVKDGSAWKIVSKIYHLKKS